MAAGASSMPKTRSVPTTWKADHDRQGDEDEHDGVIAARREARHVGLLGIERQEQEGRGRTRTATAATASVARACTPMEPQLVPRIWPKRMATRSPGERAVSARR